MSALCCISFDSYIKPQPSQNHSNPVCVVYLLIPTSNHNVYSLYKEYREVVYLLIPTSNHNLVSNNVEIVDVVYLLIPTSNHNLTEFDLDKLRLYIF